jgi:hypothetical protein
VIVPNVRASFGEREVDWLLKLLAAGDAARKEEWEERLAAKGIDHLLDHPRTAERILERDRVEVLPSRLVLYVLLRRTLLETGVESRRIADYLTALVFEFGMGDRARRVDEADEAEYDYLVDILEDLTGAEGRRAFLLKAHLGNFALWLSGLFPDHITRRVRRKGGPGMDYYEEMGQVGYRMAADAPQARRESLDRLFRDAADRFGPLRVSLNRISDRLLFPTAGSPVERLLRQARDGFADAGGAH